jgi:hypothetical protein
MPTHRLCFINWVKRWNLFHFLVRWVTKGPAGHTSVLVPEILPSGALAKSVMHVQALGGGVSKNRLSHDVDRYDYAILYVVEDDGNLDEAYDQLAALVDRKYDFLQLGFIYVARRASLLIGEKRFWRLVDRPWLKRFYAAQSEGNYICSEVASVAGKAYGASMNWPEGKPLGFIDPNAIPKIFNVSEVMRFKSGEK